MSHYPLEPVARRKDLVRVLTAPRVRRFAAALLVAVALLAAWFGSGLPFRKNVAIAADGSVVPFRTTATTVGEALEAAGVVLGSRDVVTPDLGERIAEGMTIEIRRAVPVVVKVGGFALRIQSAAPTVGEALAGSRLPIDADDKIEPGRDQAITPGLEVTVTQVVLSYQHRDDPIPFKTVRREDMNLRLGQSEVVQPGETGRESRLLLVTYEDARIVDTQELSKVVTKQPIDQILRVGTSGDIVRDGKTLHFLKSLSVKATAYEPGPVSCGPTATGYTAIGLKATKGIIAVDPRVIPLRSKVYVDGYGLAIAGDTGSAIKGNRIDVCFDTLEEALHWGVKTTKIYILELPTT